MSKRAQKYAQALRDLDGMRASGEVDDAAYQVHKRRLLAESEERPTWSVWARLGLGVLVIMFILLFLRLMG